MPPRLALYSDQRPPLTDATDAAVRSWLPVRGTVGYLPPSPDRERFWYEAREAYYARPGLSMRFFGLEDEYVPSDRATLFACDAIHLTPLGDRALVKAIGLSATPAVTRISDGQTRLVSEFELGRIAPDHAD